MNQLPNLGTGKKPSKKLFAILATAFLAVLGVVGYISLAGDAQDAPPYLGIDSSALMQGKLSKRDGFATLKTSASYSCEAEKEVLLAGNVNNVFSTKPITFAEIANSLKFDEKDGQYLIAFFSPGDDRAGKGFNEEGWYFYPTANSPYSAEDYAEFNISEDKGGDYTIPAYRGFQIIVNNEETKICGKDLKLATDKAVADAIYEYPTSFYGDTLKYWPEGWVMLPLGSDFANRLLEMPALYANGDIVTDEGKPVFDVKAVYLQTDRAKFVNDFNKDSESKYLMVWVKLGTAFDWEAFVDKMDNAYCEVNDPDYPEINGKYEVGESYLDPEDKKLKHVCVLDMAFATGGKLNDEAVQDIPHEVKDVGYDSLQYDPNTHTLVINFTGPVKTADGSPTSLIMGYGMYGYTIKIDPIVEPVTHIDVVISDYKQKVGENTFFGWSNLYDVNGNKIKDLDVYGGVKFEISADLVDLQGDVASRDAQRVADLEVIAKSLSSIVDKGLALPNLPSSPSLVRDTCLDNVSMNGYLDFFPDKNVPMDPNPSNVMNANQPCNGKYLLRTYNVLASAYTTSASPYLFGVFAKFEDPTKGNINCYNVGSTYAGVVDNIGSGTTCYGIKGPIEDTSSVADSEADAEADSEADTESDLDSDVEADSDDGLTEDVTDEGFVSDSRLEDFQFISGKKYALTIKELNNYSFVFEI